MRAHEKTYPWRALRRVKAELRVRRTLHRWRAWEPSKPALLVINHFFDNEIAALRKAGIEDHFSLFVVKPEDLFNANFLYFPPAIWYAKEPYEGDKFARARARSRAQALKLLDSLQETRPLAGILTPSDIFYWLREFIKAAPTPTVVLDKEGTISPATFEHHALKIRNEFPPIARHLYVWSKRQRDYWKRCGADVDRVRIVGSPRTDLYVAMPPPTTRDVLWFDIDPRAYIPAHKQGSWASFKVEVHTLIEQWARDFPEARFTVKMHPQQTDQDAVRQRFANAPSNVDVRGGSEAVDQLVAQHGICLGFQTTGLMEVALTDRPAVYCGWDPLAAELAADLLPFGEPGYGMHRPEGPDALDTLVRDFLGGKKLRRPGRSKLSTYFHQPDGDVAKRIVAALQEDLLSTA